MRKFIAHISLFSVFALISYGFMSFVNQNIIDQEIKNDYSNVETLILGDSRAHWINEKVIEGSLNLFQGGDTYKASYFKLLKIHEFNSNLSNVVVVFDAHNLNDLYEKRIVHEKESIKRINQIASVPDMISSTDNYKSLLEILTRYKFTFNFNPFFGHKKKYKFDDADNYKSESNLINEHQQNLNTKKDYSFLKMTDSTAINKRIYGAEWYYFRQHSGNHGSLSLEYLTKILTYNQEHQIKTTLVSMPIDPDLLETIDSKNINNFESQLKQLSTNFNFDYLNLRDEFNDRLQLLENPDHVSEYGGVIISQIISDNISKR